MKTVIEMAREAGLLTIGTADGSEAVYTWPKGITEEIERFAELVRADAIADEREAEAWIKNLEKLMADQDVMLERQTARIVDLQTHIANLEGEQA